MNINSELLMELKESFLLTLDDHELTDHFPIDEFIEYLDTALARLSGIQTKLQSYNAQKAALTEQFEKKIVEINSYINAVRKSCKHELIVKLPTHTECQICGKYL